MSTQDLPETKMCSICGELKRLSAFYAEKLGKFGRRKSCKKCGRKKRNGKKAAKFQAMVQEQPALMPEIFDAHGAKVTFEDAKDDPQLEAVVAQAMSVVGQRRMLENNRPETMTDDFAVQVKASAAVLAHRPPPLLCSCCRMDVGEDRGTYRVCRRCSVSVDRCGRCVLHLGPILRPELQAYAAPTMQQVLEALGEDQPPPPTRPPLRDADGKLPPEDDSLS